MNKCPSTFKFSKSMISKSILGGRVSIYCTSLSGSTSQNIEVDDWCLNEKLLFIKIKIHTKWWNVSKLGFSKNDLGFTMFPSHSFEYNRRMWVAYGLFPFFQVHKKISRDNLKFIWHAQPLDWKTQEKIMK